MDPLQHASFELLVALICLDLQFSFKRVVIRLPTFFNARLLTFVHIVQKSCAFVASSDHVQTN